MMRKPAYLAGVDPLKFRNIGWVVLLHGVTLVSGLILTVVMARSLGPDRLAVYAWLFSLVMLVTPLAAAMEGIAVRRMVATPGDRPVILGSMLALHMAGAIIGAIVVVTVAGLGGPPGATPGLAIVAACLLPVYVLMGLDASFRAEERIDLVVVPKITGQTVAAGGAILLFLGGAGLVAFILLRVLQTLFSSSVGAWIYFRRLSKHSLEMLALRRAVTARLFAEGWPLIASAMVGVAHLRVDQVMLGWMSPAGELASYSLAARLAETLVIVPAALRAAFYPSLVRVLSKDPDGFDSHMQRYYDLHAMLSLTGAVLLALGAFFLFVPVFGQVYAGGVVMTCILAAVVPLSSLNASRDTMLTIKGNTRVILWFAAIGLTTNLAFNVIFIPAYGGAGAALATMCSVAITLAATYLPGLTRPMASRLLGALVPWHSLRRIAALAGSGKS